MKIIIFFLGLIAITLSSFAQVGINTTAPDSSAVLDLNASNKGLLIPSMTTTQREAMQASPPATGLADGLLVYDTNYKRFYFWDISIQKWVALNTWRKEYTSDNSDAEHVTIMFLDTVENGSNLGIGETSPKSKLTVNGNISVGNTNTVAPTDGAYIDGQVRIGSGAGTAQKLEVGGEINSIGKINSESNINAEDNINSQKKIQEKGNDLIPQGSIIMWSGTVAPAGWGLCDGSVYSKADGSGFFTSPDLRGKFVVGYDPSDADYDNIGENHGVKEVTLTIDQIPPHYHNINTSIRDNYTSLQSESFCTTGCSTDPGEHLTSSTYTNRTFNHNTDSKGGGQAHENRPPYYVIAYIIKL